MPLRIPPRRDRTYKVHLQAGDLKALKAHKNTVKRIILENPHPDFLLKIYDGSYIVHRDLLKAHSCCIFQLLTHDPERDTFDGTFATRKQWQMVLQFLYTGYLDVNSGQLPILLEMGKRLRCFMLITATLKEIKKGIRDEVSLHVKVDPTVAGRPRLKNDQFIKVGERQHLCVYCLEHFPDKESVLAHVKTHFNDVETFACNICNFETKKVDPLLRHFELTHNMDKAAFEEYVHLLYIGLYNDGGSEVPTEPFFNDRPYAVLTSSDLSSSEEGDNLATKPNELNGLTSLPKTVKTVLDTIDEEEDSAPRKIVETAKDKYYRSLVIDKGIDEGIDGNDSTWETMEACEIVGIARVEKVHYHTRGNRRRRTSLQSLDTESDDGDVEDNDEESIHPTRLQTLETGSDEADIEDNEEEEEKELYLAGNVYIESSEEEYRKEKRKKRDLADYHRSISETESSPPLSSSPPTEPRKKKTLLQKIKKLFKKAKEGLREPPPDRYGARENVREHPERNCVLDGRVISYHDMGKWRYQNFLNGPQT